jgi:hypothetical protein
MKKTIFKSVLTFFVIITSLLSCSKDDDSSAPTPSSRVVKYEVTGNFSGTLDATYILANGGGTNEVISSLPWIKEITYASTVPSVGILVGGFGGTSSQTISVKIFVGGQEISSTPGTTNSNGIIVVDSPDYIF